MSEITTAEPEDGFHPCAGTMLDGQRPCPLYTRRTLCRGCERRQESATGQPARFGIPTDGGPLIHPCTETEMMAAPAWARFVIQPEIKP